MTTLQAIGFTCAGGSIVFFLCLLAFGIALRRRSVYVAPRCAARSKNTIYDPDPNHSSQYRGTALLGWIKWSLGLTYDEMLQGIPGTGTRKGGIEGSMLRTNMDGIVMLRFHTLCHKVTRVATVICLAFILPMNLTARCYEEQQSGEVFTGCQSGESYNLTNYDRTTLANIPALETDGQTSTIWGVTFTSLLGRMYGIAFCTWVITIYTCYVSRREWIEVLAMRRVYFLEDDIWRQRKKELDETLLRDDDSDEDSPSPVNRLSKTKPEKRKRKKKRKKEPSDRMSRREPWIPHPEQRDTVPNVSLYSVLVGNLPSLPQEAIMNQDDVEAAVASSQKLSIDWQLNLTTTFFDQCVPNQPGFSSSVAAVTILPAASELARAWSKWYTAASKLRRLRYIRSLISDLRYYDIQEEEESSDEEPDSSGVGPDSNGVGRQFSRRRSASEIYRNSSRKMNYYREVLGTTDDEEVESNYLLSFNFGPEQYAVYSREFAMSAAACCPNGCGERRLRRARIDELLIMEQEAIAEVNAANVALEKAQYKVTTKSEDKTDHLSPPSSPVASPLQTDFKSLALTESLETEAAIMSARPTNGMARTEPPLDLTKPSQNNGRPGLLDDPSNFNIVTSPEAVGPREGSTQSEQWALVESMCHEADNIGGSTRSASRDLFTGQWTMPTNLNLIGWCKKRFEAWRTAAKDSTNKVVDTLARDSTYAVVTFTSRQAAVAARDCLEDGRGLGRWMTGDEIPVPPLADAAPFAICPCRGCCRPVTLSINDRQKFFRRYMGYILLAAFYIFYTVPLTFATSLTDPNLWENVLPEYKEWTQRSAFYAKYLSGLIPALMYTIFFALCPLFFKLIANFGSNASSVLGAEFRAMQYYWFFMLVTAFWGTSLVQMVINGFSGAQIGAQIQDVLAGIAAAIPTQISATWINWIIVRTTVTLPLHYMLQVNTFLFSCLGWHCCSRVVRGGGPGGPVPYRVFIDAGVVLLCVVALAPASPLVAPFAWIQYLYCQPVFRRNVIFVYRPKFDGGGIRWPFLFDVIITSLLAGHILMATMLGLKKALGPAIVAAVPFLPTLLFRYEVRKQFLRAYQDAALLQTSLLDGWDINQPTSMKKREEFRRFLVDAHKAAYIPVCIAGRNEMMTAEPAAVIHHDSDEGHPSMFEMRNTPVSLSEQSGDSQFGVALRRVTPQALQRARASRQLELSGGSSRFSFSPIDEESPRDIAHDVTTL